MTEGDWLGCTDARRMLAFLNPPPNDRKVMLFAVACCRAVWPRLPRLDGFPGLEYAESWSLKGIKWAEQHADGLASPAIDLRRLSYSLEAAVLHWQQVGYEDELKREQTLRMQIEDTDNWSDYDLRRATGHLHLPLLVLKQFTEQEFDDFRTPWCMAAELAYRLPDLVRIPCIDALEWVADELLSPDLLRDIFGNPFRPVAFDPSWRTSTAVGLAYTMYESRDFGAMPVLADALEEAGCDGPDVLAHCRDPDGVHVRGCWAVDLVLGKS